MHAPLLAAINHLNTGLPAPLLVLLIMVVVMLIIWDGVWKLIALWKSARHGQLAWFICLAIFNTAGILPILYIWLFQKKAAASEPTHT
jgi:hypothetical protein